MKLLTTLKYIYISKIEDSLKIKLKQILSAPTLILFFRAKCIKYFNKTINLLT